MSPAIEFVVVLTLGIVYRGSILTRAPFNKTRNIASSRISREDIVVLEVTFFRHICTLRVKLVSDICNFDELLLGLVWKLGFYYCFMQTMTYWYCPVICLQDAVDLLFFSTSISLFFFLIPLRGK